MKSLIRNSKVTRDADGVADDSTGARADSLTDPFNSAFDPWPATDNADMFGPVLPSTTHAPAVLAAEGQPLLSDAASSASSFQEFLLAENAPLPGPGSFISAASAGLLINVTYGTSVTSLQVSNPTLFAEYTGAAQTAVDFFQTRITNPVTINITFGYGEVNGTTVTALGQNSTFIGSFTYSNFFNAMSNALNDPTASAIQKAAAGTLSATDPTNGTGRFIVTTADQKILGLGNNLATDGFIGINSTVPMIWTQPNTGASNFDAVSIFEHEISEVLGRIDFLGRSIGGFPGYSPLDFFHYSAAGGASNAAFGSAAGVLNEPFVPGYNATLQSYFSYDGLTVTLPYSTPAQVAAGNDVGDLNLIDGDSFGFGVPGLTGFVSPADLLTMNVLGYDLACFLPGTQISTPFGEVAVESLKAGDMVLTRRGEAKPITWVGSGKALATRGRRNAATPVIIHKGAIAENVPNRELRITKGHSLYIDDVLIPVEFLVNHRSIVWDDWAQEVEVYHIELAVHDVLLANGAPAESYRDDGNRWLFENANSGWDQAEKPPCGRVLTGGPIVDAVWRRLLDRSGPRPGLPTTNEPDLHLLVDGRRLDGRLKPDGVHAFRLTTPPSDVRIVSRAGAQDELGLARDPRVLGVALHRIVIWEGRHVTIASADDPRLCDGFYDYETDNDFRWTDGEAVLPPSLFSGVRGAIDVELHVGGTTQYPWLGNEACIAA